MESKNKKPYKSKYVDIFRYMMNPDYKPPLEDQLTCGCGKVYKRKQNLINHQKKCTQNDTKKITSYEDAMNRVSELIKEELAKEPNEYKAESRLYMKFIDDLHNHICDHGIDEFESLLNTFIGCFTTARKKAETQFGEFTLNINLDACNNYIVDASNNIMDDDCFIHHWPSEEENLSKAQQCLRSAFTTENATTDISGDIIHIEHHWVDEEDFPKIKSGEYKLPNRSNSDCPLVLFWSRPKPIVKPA